MKKPLFIFNATSIILVITLGLFPHLIFAQNGNFYSSNADISNSLINDVYQDNKGFVWIATEDGLNKFDGNTFTIYRHKYNDSTSLTSNYVNTLFQDSQERLWILCINGVQRYDYATNGFKNYPIIYENTKVPPQTAPSIIELPDSEIWVATFGQGIVRLKNNKFVPYQSLNKQIGSTFIPLIFKDSKQNVWIIAQDKGLFRYSLTSKELTSLTDNVPYNSDNISSICEDKSGNIYLGTYRNGLLKYTYDNHLFESIKDSKNEALSIKTLMVDTRGDNTLYIGTEGTGLKILKSHSNQIVDYPFPFQIFNFSSTKIHTILKDKDNNLWLGMFQKGVMMLPDSKCQFEYNGYKSYLRNNIGSSCIMAICTDNTQTTWIGTDNDGIYALDTKGNAKTHYKKGIKGTVPPNVMSIFQDSEKKIWVGSYFSGLMLMKPTSGQCTPISLVKNESERIYNIMEDFQHHIWVSTYGSGIFKLNLQGNVLSQYESSQLPTVQNIDTINQLCNNSVNCIYQASDSLLWIGTCNGLSCLNPKNDNFINYFGTNDLLPNSFVHCITEDVYGNIWIGTANGLYKFDKKRQIFSLLTTKQGLPSDVICGIESDNNNLWISTHKGISKYNLKSKSFFNYFADDGLQGNEFTRGAFCKSKDGKIYFGGINGITSFYPKNVIESRKKLHIQITNFYINNKSINTNDSDGHEPIITTDIMDARNINLAHSQNSFTIEFSTMIFLNPESFVYEYKIDELDDKWNSTTPGMNRVSYTNLPPGNYTFQVRARDNGNYSDIRTIHIHIKEPWVLSGWAILLWIGLTVTFFYFVIMYVVSIVRRKRKRRERQQKEKINEAKLQFFTNMSHEIRTPMTLIMSPLEKFITKKGPQQQEYLMMYRNAKRILRIINQMMDIRKLDSGQMTIKCRETNMVGFIEDLMHTFEYPAKQKNITFTFVNETADKKDLKVWIDLNNFDKILVNVLSNAFKFTPNDGTITVYLKTGVNATREDALKRYFEIDVSDTGIGIEPDKIDHIFDRFYQIDSEYTKSYVGNGIGLDLSKQLVLLHHGEIHAENNSDGKGSTFIIKMPLGNAHLKPDEIIQSNNGTNTTIENFYFTSDEKDNQNKKKLQKSRYNILIVEDDIEIQDYLRQELEKEYHISTANDGGIGFEKILQEKPNLVISDIMMPKMDGYMLCKKVKHNENVNTIPIILLTAKTDSTDKIEGLEVGADAYFTKPFNVEMLKTTIQNLIKNREIVINHKSNTQLTNDHISQIHIQMKSNDEVLLNKIMEIITQHLNDPELSVEMLATTIGMSRVHVYRKIKSLTGVSASDYIKTVRLKKAAQLLNEKGPNISEVAYATGFSSLSHFSNSFHDFYGISPTNYKTQINKQNVNESDKQKNS